jgi:hypothetical protein
MGNSKACRYSRRLALALEEDFGTSLQGEVYQMNLASKSLFGDAVGDNTYPFENYAKYLANNGKSLDYVVTQISFNEENDNQSVLFTPLRHINKGEYDVTNSLGGKPEVQKMVIMTPYQADASGRQALAAPAEKPAPAKAEASEEIPEPTKRESAKATPAAAPAKKELKDVLKAWGDEE